MPKVEPLYLTEAEIAARVGVAPADWQHIASTLEKSGLPRASQLFGGKRYWPAVRDFLDRWEGRRAVSAPSNPARDGVETWENLDKPRRRA